MIRVFYRGAFFKKYVDLECSADNLPEAWEKFIGSCKCVVDSAWLLDDTKWHNSIEQVELKWDSRDRRA